MRVNECCAEPSLLGACEGGLYRRLWTVALLTVLFICAASPGAALAGSCASTIAKCGCTIRAKGLYTVTAALDATQGLTGRGDCIDISAPNVTLDLKSFSVTGSGTGVGIHILNNVNPSKSGNQATVIQSTCCGTISDWHIGVEDDASNADILFIDVESSAGDGILLKGVNASQVWDLSSDHNAGAGVRVKGGTNSHIFESGFDNNSTGIEIDSGATNTRIDDSGANTNGTGIFLAGSSSNSHILSTGSTMNTGVGVLIAKHSTKNVVGDVAASSNKTDMEDDNAGCDTNTWFDNSFTTANRGCIH